MLFVYNLALALASIVLVPFYLLRGRGGGKYCGTLRQRLGWLGSSLRETDGRAIWLHAVSVGEVLSCQELVAGLRRRLPYARILISTTTKTGQAMAREKLGGIADDFFYAPVDVPFAIRNTLRRVRPCLLIVAETEIWPNLFHQTKRFGASLLLVNARISDRSAPRYRKLRFFFRRVLRQPDAILAQSPLDRQRLIEAGAPLETVEVGGNLKFDFRSAGVRIPAELESLLQRSGAGPVILAGSTREGEEEQVVAGFRQAAQKHRNALLIVAPRHPERFDAVAEALSESGFGFLRRSRLPQGAALSLPGILLLDSLGELASLYQVADAVFVGGSLVPWGGHNVLEPAFAGRPIVTGPHMQNFRAIAGALLAAEAMIQVNDARELGTALLRLIDRPSEASALGARARRLAESHRGAAERAAERAVELYHAAIPNDPPGWVGRVLLGAPALVFRAAARLRLRAYEKGWKPRRRLDTFTVSIGNLTAGGTGKTPVTQWLIEQIETRGLRCAVLTRGYRRSSREAMMVLGPDEPALASRTGDEAQIIRKRFAIPMGIGADRYRSGKEIERRFHPDVFLLDDGFQHMQLERDLDIVLIDVMAPFGRGALLPLGRLREPPASLARAGVLLLTRAEPWERWEGLRQQLRRYNPHAPIFFVRIEPAAWVHAASGEEKPLSHLDSMPVLAFCGVANPDSFWRAVAQTGARPAARVCYRDHHRYSAADVRRLSACARQAGAAASVTTEKDVINLPPGQNSWPAPLYWLKIRVSVEDAGRLLDEILNRVLPARERAVR
jgi:tetraacyldisaccharide 4'-kinase